jgi:uncharacterized protein RhaS with RHS repeats
MGRFMSPDPIGKMKQKMTDPQQWNMYSYVRNNPLRLTDPTGMYAVDCGSLNAKNCAKKTAAIDAEVTKLASSKNAQDQAIAKTLGTSKDTKNGVTIGFVKDFKDKNGNVLPNKVGNTNGAFTGTETGIAPAIRIDIKSSQSGNDLLATTVHEGAHAADDEKFINSCGASGCSQSLNPTGRETEQNAYGAEYRFWQSVGQGSEHDSISSPDKINKFLGSDPSVYPPASLDNKIYPTDD